MAYSSRDGVKWFIELSDVKPTPPFEQTGNDSLLSIASAGSMCAGLSSGLAFEEIFASLVVSILS